MTNSLRTIIATALLVGLTLAPVAAQQKLSAEETETIKKEVIAAVDTYYRLFSERNMKALPEQVYNIPWILMSGNGPQADLTKEQALGRFEASLKQLLANGWDKSVFTTKNVCVLNASAAIASGFNTRTKKDGSVLQVMGTAYVFNKTKDGWRIVTYTGIPVDRVVRCD